MRIVRTLLPVALTLAVAQYAHADYNDGQHGEVDNCTTVNGDVTCFGCEYDVNPSVTGGADVAVTGHGVYVSTDLTVATSTSVQCALRSDTVNHVLATVDPGPVVALVQRIHDSVFPPGYAICASGRVSTPDGDVVVPETCVYP